MYDNSIVTKQQNISKFPIRRSAIIQKIIGSVK